MSQPLQSLVYKTLSADHGKVFSIELPRANGFLVAQKIEGYCQQLDRPYLVVSGNALNKKILLTKLQGLFSQGDRVCGFKPSRVRAITDILRRHRDGVLCINDAQSMTPDGERVLLELVSYVRKHKLSWKFYFLSKRSEEASQLNLSLGVQKSLMWSEKHNDWFFVEKADVNGESSLQKVPMVKWVSVTAIVLFAIYLFLYTQPKPRINNGINQHMKVNAGSDYPTSEYD